MIKIVSRIKDQNAIFIGIAVGWIWVLFNFFVLDSQSFQDSGSVLVMFCVLNEFYMQRLKEKENISFSNTFKIINTYSIAIGTLIWGYGKTLLSPEFSLAFGSLIGVLVILLVFISKFIIKITEK